MPRSLPNDAVHGAEAAGFPRMAGFEVAGDVGPRPGSQSRCSLGQVYRRPTARLIRPHGMEVDSAGQGPFRYLGEQQVAGRMTGAAMTERPHQVGAAIPLGRAGPVGTVHSPAGEQPLPEHQASAPADGERQIVRRGPETDRFQRLDVGEKRRHVIL